MREGDPLRRVPFSVVQRGDSELRSTAPEAVEPLQSNGIPKMRRDGDKFLTAALLDPWRHRLDRMGERIGADRFETAVLREPFEVPPRREDQPCFAPLLAFQDRVRSQPRSAGTFACDHLRLPI